MPFLKSLVVAVVIPLLSSAETRGYLQVTVMKGEGSFNDVRRHLGHRPVVHVTDEMNNPVPGAQVTFLMPAIGPSGRFADGSRQCTVAADAQGVAEAAEFTPNYEEGRLSIKVSATYQGKTGSAVVSQSNTAAGGYSLETKGSSGRGKKLAILVIAVGGAVGAALAFRGGNSSPSSAPPPAVTLTPGTISVGSPH